MNIKLQVHFNLSVPLNFGFSGAKHYIKMIVKEGNYI